MHHKTKKHLKRLLVVVLALVLIGALTSFVGNYFTMKADRALGISGLQITDVSVNNTYDGPLPKVIISFKTTKPATVTVELNEYHSMEKRGTNFSEEITLQEEYFGKSVALVITADNTREKAEYRKTVFIPKNMQPTITIN